MGNKSYNQTVKVYKLSCIIRLFQLKVLNNWSDKSAIMLMLLVKEKLLDGRIITYILQDKKRRRRKLLQDLDLFTVR